MYREKNVRLIVFTVLFVLLLLAVIVLAWLPLIKDVGAETRSNVISPYIGIDYSPYRDNETPAGPYPTREEIFEDIKLISESGIKHIRLYSSGYNCTADIMDACRQYKIKVGLGCWINQNNKDEFGNMIWYAREYPDVIEFLIVGNETQSDWSENPIDEDELIEMISTAKSVGIPVTAAEHPFVWLDRPGTLGKAVDFIWIQSFPLWNQRNINQGLSDLTGNYLMVASEYPDKQVVIGETGWPTAGQDLGQAHPSEVNQERFIRDVVAWTRNNQVTVYFFEFADESWKYGLDFEPHWGLLNLDRSPKPAWQEVLKVFPKIFLPRVGR